MSWYRVEPHLSGVALRERTQRALQLNTMPIGLNAKCVTATEQAQIVINHWLKPINHIRPHQALNMRPPVPETPLEKRHLSGQKHGARHTD